MSGMIDTVGSKSGIVGSDVYPAGHVLQIVDSKKTDTSSRNAASWGDIGGTDQAGAGSVWCCKITPNATSSKILVCAGISYGRQGGNLSANFLWVRDGGGTDTFMGNAASGQVRSWHGGYGGSDHWNHVASVQFLDSPSTTSEVTYKVQFRSESISYYTWVNRSHSDSASSNAGFRGASVITLMEVAG